MGVADEVEEAESSTASKALEMDRLRSTLPSFSLVKAAESLSSENTGAAD